MVEILENFNLKEYNTFGLNAKAKFFAQFSSVEELVELLDRVGQDKFMILGGGSNILLINDFDGWVLLNRIEGREITYLEDEKVLVSLGGGENWHECVLWALENNFSGLENLSLIPGCVGASPIQNIGAYGVELKDIFVSLEALNFETREVEVFNLESCDFGYRDSFFKKEGKGKYAILRVQLMLSKNFSHVNVSYGAIQNILNKKNIVEPNAKDVSDAVIAIRQSKLPDPKKLGNAGSFFKNPVVEEVLFNQIREEYPEIPHYPSGNNFVKIPAGWLIEKAGMKGVVYGNTGSHKDQALVIVNYGEASGEEIWGHAERVIDAVSEQFGIELQAEVNIVG